MNEGEIKPDTFPKYTKSNSILASIPLHLKDHANYEKTQRVIIESLAGKCSHGEILEWAECPKCQTRFTERRFLLKKLGFKNPAQYMAWCKIHAYIEKETMVRFPKYNKP